MNRAPDDTERILLQKKAASTEMQRMAGHYGKTLDTMVTYLASIQGLRNEIRIELQELRSEYDELLDTVRSERQHEKAAEVRELLLLALGQEAIDDATKENVALMTRMTNRCTERRAIHPQSIMQASAVLDEAADIVQTLQPLSGQIGEYAGKTADAIETVIVERRK